MTHRAGQHPNRFQVGCCKRDRFLLPGGVLVCHECDRGGQVPRYAEATVVPVGTTMWPPDEVG